jgi:hypothetical protein
VSDLSRRAYQLRCEIKHVIATTHPDEVDDRIEDVAHDALDEVERGTRRAVHREYAT